MSVFYRSIASDIGSISEPLLNLLPTFVNEEPIFLGFLKLLKDGEFFASAKKS